ncbi:MAG: efflux RND transporter periplasmic adaptor subunit [Gammaproteobacteria bacterium]|nr:efflux RND transporter periplasmic adaptor subunit [Gammaproteobacteria bacterium]
MSSLTGRSGALFLFLLFASEGFAQGGAPPGVPVRVAVAEQLELAPTVWVSGAVVGRNDARLAAEVSARLVEIAEIGSRVKSGDVVARLDETEIALEGNEARAVAAREKARFAFAEQELKRFRSLADAGLVTRSQLEQARTQRDASRGEWNAAQARLDRAEDRLARTRIRAPFDGVVTERLRQAGERVESGAEVLRLVNPDTLEVQVRVPSGTLPHVPSGTVLPIRGANGEVQGTVRTVVPVGDDRSRLYELRVGIPGAGWPAGTTVRVRVPTAAARSVVAVPRDALVLRRTGTTVYRVKADGSPERLSVQTGVASETLIEVISDLAAGDQVIVRGAERLYPGAKVMIQNPPGPADGQGSKPPAEPAPESEKAS